MDISTLLNGLVFGFTVTTVLTVFGMTGGGLVLALYTAIPRVETWLDGRALSKHERAYLKAMADIDREFMRQMKDLQRKTRAVIHVEY